MIDLIPDFAGWLVAAIAAIAGIWGLAKRDARRGAALDAARDHINTTERMRDATDHLPADDPAIRDWLRQRGSK